MKATTRRIPAALTVLLAASLGACRPAPSAAATDVASEYDGGASIVDDVGVTNDSGEDSDAGDAGEVRDQDVGEDPDASTADAPDLHDADADTNLDAETSPDSGPQLVGPLQTVTLVPHERPLVDPERGWVEWVNLMDDDLDALRRYRAERSLGWAGVNLGEFRDAPISDEFLARLDSGLFNARDAGLKVVLRFRYDATEAGVDAPLDRVLQHITQLTPLLRAHSDVIYLLEAGFIGAWGEWHSSTNGLDEPLARSSILDALRAALPENRFVSVRTPMFKAEAYGGPLEAGEAFSGAALARVGHHNDCFLASDSDLGTYADPVRDWVNYVAAESPYVPVGGETCAPNPPRSECASALAELQLLRFSYLSSAWNPDVLSAWEDGGCLDEIGRRLGHRLQVEEYTLNEWASPGATATLRVRIRNVGFAPLRNPRGLAIWIVEQGVVQRQLVEGIDPRTWAAGESVELEFEIDFPPTGVTYEYSVLLGLPDGSEALGGVPTFATQFANDEMLPEFGAVQLGTILVGGALANPDVEFAVRGRQLP